MQEIIAAQLLAAVEEQGVYKFIVYSGIIEQVEDALLVSQIP